MSENELYKSGAHLICPYTARDSSNTGIAGLTVEFSIFKRSTAKYFDNGTGLFDSTPEVMNTAAEISHGSYEYTLTNGYSADDNNYRVRTRATETVTGDIADFRVVQSNIGTLDAIKAKTDNLPHSMKKNTAIPDFKFVMLDSTTGNPVAGLAVTATRKLDDDASWTVMAGSPADNGEGAYSIDITAADNNGDAGIWKFTAPGAKTTFVTFLTEAV